jgi:transcriptional regulator with XRE-family HTH domain
VEHNEGALTPTQVIAHRVREERRRQGLTAAQLAAQMTKAGVAWNRQKVTKLENGHRPFITVDELFALAKALGVALTALLPPPPGVEERAWQLAEGMKQLEAQARQQLADVERRWEEFYRELKLEKRQEERLREINERYARQPNFDRDALMREVSELLAQQPEARSAAPHEERPGDG